MLCVVLRRFRFGCLDFLIVSSMLQLRPDQLDVFAEPAFERRIAALLRENLPPVMREMPETLLVRVARHTIAVARSYKLLTEREIGTFALQMVHINPEFHLQPRLHAILSRPAAPGVDRLEALLAEGSDDDWTAAQGMSDGAAYWSRVLSAPDGSEQTRGRMT